MLLSLRKSQMRDLPFCMIQASLHRSKFRLKVTILQSKTLTRSSIIILHGLGGHPHKTFASSLATDLCRDSRLSKNGSSSSSSSKILSRALKKFTIRRTSPSSEREISGNALEQGSHWPRDFLPRDCPHSRIMTWGYDSHITKGYAQSNKSNVFAHAKDLLYSLRRDRALRRPIIFVAHSLGGLIVKEASFTCLLAALTDMLMKRLGTTSLRSIN
jgi:hypothetical protein